MEIQLKMMDALVVKFNGLILVVELLQSVPRSVEMEFGTQMLINNVMSLKLLLQVVLLQAQTQLKKIQEMVVAVEMVKVKVMILIPQFNIMEIQEQST